MSVATVWYAHGLATQGIGLTQTSRIALGADAFARLTADFIVSAGDIALRLTEESRAVQLVTLVAATSAIQKALTMRATQRAGGHTIVAIVEHEIIKALTLSSWQTEAILLAPIAAVWHTSRPIVLVAPPTLAANLDDIVMRICCAIAHNFDLLVVLKEDRTRGKQFELRFIWNSFSHPPRLTALHAGIYPDTRHAAAAIGPVVLCRACGC